MHAEGGAAAALAHGARGERRPPMPFAAGGAPLRNALRAGFVALALLAQLGGPLYLLLRARAYYPLAALAMKLLALAAAAAICGACGDSASRVSWMALILLLPLPGLCLYLLLGQPWTTASARRRFAAADAARRARLLRGEGAPEPPDPAAAGVMRYIRDWGGYPAYRDTRVEFHPQGALAFAALKRELRRARRFIFMEYHAIELSRCFLELEAILTERAAAGVEVRLFYDDVGSIGFIGPDFVRRMEARGVRCRVFNPLTPALRPFMNHRDHRKLTVIDGDVAFTGGYNLADEYFGASHPHGHWKDTGLMLRGAAVRSLTAMFLEMWSAAGGEAEADPGRWRGGAAFPPSDGWVQPFAANPLSAEPLGENVYLALLQSAREYAWITTPYLIPDDAMLRELTLAARRGVDVRVIAPGIPDKRPVFRLTRSYCAQLARGGVRVYEYAPGFLHAKQLLVDGASAVVGTINLDFRSLHMHFEDAVLLHRCAAVADIRRDFEATLALCREIVPRGRAARIGPAQGLLRLFAPLL